MVWVKEGRRESETVKIRIKINLGRKRWRGKLKKGRLGAIKNYMKTYSVSELEDWGKWKFRTRLADQPQIFGMKAKEKKTCLFQPFIFIYHKI